MWSTCFFPVRITVLEFWWPPIHAWYLNEFGFSSPCFMFIFRMVFTKKKALQIFTYMKIHNKFMQNPVPACFPRIVRWSHFTMSNPIDAKAQIRMSMYPYSLIVSFSLHVLLGSFTLRLKLLARACQLLKEVQPCSICVWNGFNDADLTLVISYPKKEAVKLMKRVYGGPWIVSLFASIACLLCTTYM